MKKVLLIIIVLIIGLMMLSQFDDDLSEEASGLINRLEVGGNSQAYLYLAGIFANEKDKPEEVGRKLYSEYQKLETDETYEVVDYQKSLKIPLPDGELFCTTWEEGCLNTLFSVEPNFFKQLTEHDVLISRSNTFLDFEEYRTLAKPSIKELIPSYQYITAAERIKVLHAIDAYKNDNSQQAVDSLLSQLEKLRRSLALQDTLIGKLVFLMKASEIMDVLSIILTSEGAKVEKISPMSHAEKSFSMVVAREFGMFYHLFKNLDKHPDIFEIGGNFPGWITRIMYKPNMTINAITPMYYRLDRLAKLSPSEFANELKTGNDFYPSTSKVLNYIGSVLISMSPDFDEYVARFKDFEVKLALFNQRHSSEGKSPHLNNFYYGNEALIDSGEMICAKGPMEDTRFLRCLRLKI